MQGSKTAGRRQQSSSTAAANLTDLPAEQLATAATGVVLPPLLIGLLVAGVAEVLAVAESEYGQETESETLMQAPPQWLRWPLQLQPHLLFAGWQHRQQMLLRP